MPRLRPSQAVAWLNCPKSPTMGDSALNIDTPFTRRGSVMHLQAARVLREILDIPQITLEYTKDNTDAVKYALFCNELVTRKLPSVTNIHYLVEEKIFLSDFLVEGNGIVDFAAYAEDNVNLVIIDYKTGFQRVYANQHPQLNFYGLGLATILRKKGYPIEIITLAISQPSQEHSSVVTFTYDELVMWYKDNKQKILDAHDNRGNYNTGKHCAVCSAYATCKAHILSYLTGEETNNEYEIEAD